MTIREEAENFVESMELPREWIASLHPAEFKAELAAAFIAGTQCEAVQALVAALEEVINCGQSEAAEMGHIATMAMDNWRKDCE